jgi:hypothetical protein
MHIRGVSLDASEALDYGMTTKEWHTHEAYE